MCGICGIVYSDSDRKVDENVLSNINNAMIHRGPDDQGYYFKGAIGLGMRRLSIIDVEGGHQPFHNEDNTICCVCNGEIYNYIELRDNLVKKGHIFKTDSDCEVVLHQYEEDGEGSLQSLNGMFGLAIWDERKNKLLIARDRIGIKPLYYYIDDEKLIFASEVKAIIQYPGLSAEVDNQALWDYLTFRYIPAPMSMFKNISKLFPGYYGIKCNNSFEIYKYWDIPTRDMNPPVDHDLPSSYYVDQFKLQLRKSVKSHLMSDVPLGVLLSGGLDSSAILSEMRELGVTNIKTFSVGFDAGKKYNELNYAKIVAQHFKTDHHEVVINPELFISGLQKFLYYTDEPLADLACVPLWFVSKLAKEHVKVVLSGEGADELLAGYPGMENYVWKSKITQLFQRLPQTLRDSLLMITSPSLLGTIHHKLNKLNQPIDTFGLQHQVHMANYFSSSEKKALITGAEIDIYDSFSKILQLYKTQKGKKHLDQLLYVYCKSWLPDNLLTKADRMTMGNSLELRVPFLDNEMVNFSFTLPDRLKISNGFGKIYKAERKFVLREIMRGKLPEIIINRKKYGFPTPENVWLCKELREYSRDILSARNSFAGKYFSTREIERLLDLSDNDDSARSKIWLLITLEEWYKSFDVM